MEFIDEVKIQLKKVAEELIEKANLSNGDVVVVGCSSSEILGDNMGTNSSPELGEEVFLTLNEVFKGNGIFVAAQCCEHLNRAIIIEREAAKNVEQVNVVPVPKAGGSFATAAYKHLKNPVAVESIIADAGLDIGGVLIGMHLKNVAVPVKLSEKSIGNALLLVARTRPKFIGGSRANYDESLL
ncbi:MAG: TIGR01440 family protein [Clostridia bacterium]|nr:TIGR01440 family protein [Clostridia bacterium]